MASMEVRSQSIVIDQSSDRKIAVEMEDLRQVQEGEVKIKLLAAPINPLDLEVFAGVYPVRPQHFSNNQPILGYDGLAEVVEVGNNITDLVRGDLVIPSRHGLGTWRTSAIVSRAWVDRIPKPDDTRFGAILKGSVMPAYFLTEDMVKLKPNDYIIVNAATSIISQYVVQFARLKGVHVISVIRDREEKAKQEVEQKLLSMGAAKVITESQLAEGATILAGINIVMAIDSVFGTSGHQLLKSLTAGGTYVQLGFLGGAKSTLSISAMDLWAKQSTMRAFRGQAQLTQRSEAERAGLRDWLVTAFNSKMLTLPALGLEMVQWNHDDPEATLDLVAGAMGKARAAGLGQRKQVLLF